MDLPQVVALRAETTGCGEVNSFGCAAVETGFLVDENEPVEAKLRWRCTTNGSGREPIAYR